MLKIDGRWPLNSPPLICGRWTGATVTTSSGTDFSNFGAGVVVVVVRFVAFVGFTVVVYIDINKNNS